MLLLASCSKEAVLPSASGRPYEVLVIMDHDMCNRPVGRALIDDVLHLPVRGIPQEEYSFDVMHSAPDSMNYAKQLVRNVIELDINPQRYTHTKMKFMRNKHAMEQIWMTIQSPSEDSLTVYLQKYGRFITEFLTKTEMNRLIVRMKKKNSEVVGSLAHEMFNCEVLAPEELISYKRGEKFFWTSGEIGSGLVNICMYSFPYTGPESFTKFNMLHKRDSVMHFNIPGEAPGMFMKTDTLRTVCKPIAVHGDYAYEARGWWDMENDYMGGPFVSHARVDTDRNEVIVIEAFVYNPGGMKRGLIRRLEASLYSMILPCEKNKKHELDTNEVEEEEKEVGNDR